MNHMYFKIADSKFANRRLAEIYKKEKNINSDIEFVCAPNLDFSVPAVSLVEAVNHEIKKLREKFDYLQLFYSGGADSHTILKGFIDSDIRLDEIVVSRWSVNDNFNEAHNTEINDTAIPVLKNYSSYLDKWKVKITFCDFGKDLIEKLYSDQTFLTEVAMYGVTNPCVYNIVNYAFPKLQQHTNMQQIVGWEKPSIKLKDNKFYTFMLDKTIMFYSHSSFNADLLCPFYLLDNSLVAVTQNRIATQVIKQYYANYQDKEFFVNSDKKYFKLVNDKVRNAVECETSNTQLLGKNFTPGKINLKEGALFDSIKLLLPSTWETITSTCNTDDYISLINYCSFNASKDSRDLPALIAKEIEIL